MTEISLILPETKCSIASLVFNNLVRTSITDIARTLKGHPASPWADCNLWYLRLAIRFPLAIEKSYYSLPTLDDTRIIDTT